METAKRMLKSKTTWAGISAIAATIGLWVTGQITTAEAVGAIFAAIGTMTVRDTIATAGKGNQ